MAEIGIQGGSKMWPSEAIASLTFNVANIALIVSLVTGVIATCVVVWMGNVKEEYLRRSLADTTHEAALAIERAAKATDDAAKAQLALEQYKAPRTISDAHATQMQQAAEPFAGTHVEIFLTNEATEVLNLSARITEILEKAHWHQLTWIVMSGAGATGTVVITRNGAQNIEGPAQALVLALNSADVSSSRNDGLPAWQANWNAAPGILNGPLWANQGHADIRLVIGTKN
jgi:hypothetical protein